MVVAPDAVDPAAVANLSAASRAAVSFVAVLIVGTAILLRSRGFVEGATETSFARPHVSVLYGVVGYGLVSFVGFVGLTQLSYVGLSGSVVGAGLVVLVGLALFVLTVLGGTVVGTGLVGVVSERQPWTGLVLVAACGAGAWLVLPPLGVGAAWLLVAAVGLGGPIRAWIHTERTVAAERRS